MVRDFEKYFPIWFIDENVIVNKDESITIGYNILLPEVFSLTRDQFNRIHNHLNMCFGSLPTGTIVQIQNFFFIDRFIDPNIFEKSLLADAYSRYITFKPIVRHFCRIFVTYNPSATRTRKDASEKVMSLNQFKKALETINGSILSMNNSISSIPYIISTKLSSGELEIAVKEFVNMTYADSLLNKNGNYVYPYEITENYLKIGDKYISILTEAESPSDIDVATKPDAISSHAIGSPIEFSNSIELDASFVYPIGLGLVCDHIVNITIQVLDGQVAIKALKKKNNLNGLGIISSAKKTILEIDKDIDAFESEIKETKSKGCKMALNVILINKDLDKLKNLSYLTQLAFGKMNGAQAFIENVDATKIFLSCIPGNGNANIRLDNKVTMLGAALAYVPLETVYRSDKRGLMFFDRPFGNPIMLDISNAFNKNMIVIGSSGGGKSYLMNNIMNQLLMMKAYVSIIDIDGSYTRNIINHNGKVLDAKSKKGFSTNIFLINKNEENKYQLYNIEDEERDDQVVFIYTVLIKIWKSDKEANNDEINTIRIVIEKFYDYVNSSNIKIPILNDFYDYIDVFREKEINEKNKYLLRFFDFDSFKLCLSSFVHEGTNAELLNSESEEKLEDYSSLYADFAAIKNNKDLLRIVCVITIEKMLRIIKAKSGQDIFIVIDEALDFLVQRDSSMFIAYLFRVIRKKGGGVVIVTQSAGFFKELDEIVKNSIIMNAGIKLFTSFKEAPEEYKLVSEVMGVSKAIMEKHKTVTQGKNFREFSGIFGGEFRILRNVLIPETDAVFTTNKKEMDRVLELYNESKSMSYAINQYTHEKFSI